MSILSLGPLKHLVILGACDFAPDLEAFAQERKISISFITSPDQSNDFLIKRKDNLLVTSTLDYKEITTFLNRENADPQGTLAISFGARWIFRKEFIETVFNGRLLNAHGARLPYDRGGGGFSWRIMRGDRLGQVLIHQIDEGIDTGAIVYQKPYVIPPACVTPDQIVQDYMLRLKETVVSFLSGLLEAKVDIPLMNPAVGLGSYFPRLSTEIHGWIDWSWQPNDLVNFIHAYDDPYLGAQTYLNEKSVRIKKVQLHAGEFGFHPFQSGLVVRKEESWLIVALQGQYSLIVEQVSDFEKIKEGDRFHTPSAVLEKARAQRVGYTANGLKT